MPKTSPSAILGAKDTGSLVSFDQVGLRYSTGPEVLHDITFDLAEGSFHYLTGASGAGKTSLMRLLYLGQKPTRGLIRMFGKDVSSADREGIADMRRDIGVVFQDFRLLNHLTVFENVALPLKIGNIIPEDIRTNVTELLKWVGLGDKLHVKPMTLSGGEQQRVAIARAVIGRPRLLLADEPTGNVDEKIGVRLIALFEQLNKLGTTIVIATHDMHLIERFPHDVLHLSAGDISLIPAAHIATAAA